MKLNNDFLIRSRVETEEHWGEWCEKLPYLHFKEKYEVKIIPPFTGALVRFVVKYNDKSVSVYFDGYSKLGLMYDNNDEPIPYFEAYPIEGDIRRYYITDSDEMMKDIETELEEENQEEEYHDCSICKHFDWVQDAKYFGRPCEIHGTAYSIGCKDYEEIPKKGSN